MSQFYATTIKEITIETPDAVSISFNIPSDIQQEFSFVAGQYITLKATINGEDTRRAYSLCSSPKSNEIKVAIKRIENGKFSTYATKELQQGNAIEISKPDGKFILNPQGNKNYIGFSAGSGITPILSMIKSVLETEPSSTFTLIYGNKKRESTIFYTELNELVNNYPNFKVHYIFSQENTDESLSGRIDRGNTNNILKNIYTDKKFDDAFLCGPEAMIDLITGVLIENGFERENIHYELFTASSNEEIIEEIGDGTSEIKFILDDEETTFTMEQTDTILAAALRNKLDAPYSCQGGVCSSCIAKVVEGKAVMSQNQVLSDEDLEEGLILTCKAHPTTGKIVVDYDDV